MVIVSARSLGGFELALRGRKGGGLVGLCLLVCLFVFGGGGGGG